MARLLIHVEGETEESFVNELLASHLLNFGYTSVSARLIGNARLRDRRGGIRAWASVKKDIVSHLKEDITCLATTLVDYYALPQTGEKAWPGREKAKSLPFMDKAACVEKALSADINSELGDKYNAHRFIPFVVMHEFEGLLFSNCQAFATGIGQSKLAPMFQEIRNQFASPEEINDSPLTAPSKRIGKLVPGYEKPLHGTLAALEIGLAGIKRECPHFRHWLERLESGPK